MDPSTHTRLSSRATIQTARAGSKYTFSRLRRRWASHWECGTPSCHATTCAAVRADERLPSNIVYEFVYVASHAQEGAVSCHGNIEPDPVAEEAGSSLFVGANGAQQDPIALC